MKIRFGFLTVSLTALVLAVAAFPLQATQADPVAVAEFGPAPAFVADAEPLDETAAADPGEWLHPAAAQETTALCAGSQGVKLISLSGAIGVVCQDETAMGFLLTPAGREPQLILAPEAKHDDGKCPSGTGEDTPEPSA
jgi:hypothetical protein